MMLGAAKLLGIGLATLALHGLSPATVWAKSNNENLLLKKEVALDRTHSSGLDFAKEALLRDGDQQTSSQIEVSPGKPVELVFYFGGQTVSPNSLN